MKEIKIHPIIKNLVIYFFVFVVGVIGTILMANNQIQNATSQFTDQPFIGTKNISFFGIPALQFEAVEINGSIQLNITQSAIYDFIPLIVGAILVITTILLTLCIKKWTNNKRNSMN